MKNRTMCIFTRLVSLLLALVLTISAIPAISPVASAATYNWPTFSKSSYLEMVLFGASETLPVYMDPELKTRGTCQPWANYNSYLEAGDSLKIYSISSVSTEVEFPTKNGTKVGYVSTKSLFGVASPTGTFTSKASVSVLNINKTITKYGSTAVGDAIIPCATAKNGYILILYSAVKGSRAMKAGFVSSEDFNKLKNGSAQPSSGSNSAKVTLNVPSYKQTDSRWSSTKIGTKSIGKIGCLVTSLAMVHSYKTGSTIYPDSMMGKLSFSNNDLYWSSAEALGYKHLSYKTGITNAIMSKIYEQLDAGKPVIIGAYSSSKGYSHWVVVTGYTGNSTDSFDPANFTINDPSANRTTLAQFLGVFSSVRGLVY